ncbi:MAG: FAD-binding oxidoreductase [Chloroflexi bacterium]|nr:FAD-binding oxidoreductase [Chloroflexota bacterium]
MTTNVRNLASALAAIVGAPHVLAGNDDREEYAYDALPPSRAETLLGKRPPLPDVVVRPGTTAEVQAIVRLANETGTPIVPWGGGTGVLGGAVPLRAGITLDLRRLNRVRHVSVAGMTALAEAGIYLSDLNAALGKDGLMCGHDPWSAGIATLGGAISTGGAGYLLAKYGTMAEQMLALEVVLPNGDLMEARHVTAAAGPKMHGLFIGAEGTLGVINAALIKAFPLPERRTLRAFGFSTFDDGYAAIVEMGRRGVKPAMLDYAQRPTDADALMHLAFEGFAAEVAAHESQAVAICQAHHARDLGEQEAREFWDTRHQIADYWKERMAKGRRFARNTVWPGMRWFDYLNPAVPADRIPEYRRRCEEILAEAGLASREYDIWGRPDLFTVVVVAQEGREVDQAAAQRTSERLMRLAQEMGGSMECIHGVGVKFLGLWPSEPGAGLDALRAIKRALDPKGIMNPGKLALG